jgi:hypothetical protein
MQIVSIFFTLGILIFVGLFLYAPLLERRAHRVTPDEQELSTLLAERERTLSSLQELEFDYSLGKVPEEDYPVQRAGLIQRGAEILRRLDQISPQKAQDDSDAHIERAIASRRRNGASKSPERIDEEIESMISSRRMGRKEKSAGFCPKCGKPVMASDKFCPLCGKALIQT